ncbi:MAG: hypothetical protein HQ582_13920 [Planctomycetes bacterium]|nr:hypothetical protein [Planctomycetota bacterium]
MLLNRIAVCVGLLAIAFCVCPAIAQDDCCGDVAACCDDACATCCDCSGIVIGAEVLWLDVFAKEGAGGTDPNAGGDDHMADWDYDTAFRIWGGYEFSNGLGIRCRWFSFDHAGQFRNDIGNVTDNVGLDIDMYDIELTDDLNIGCWELTPSIGVRWGEIEMVDFGDDVDKACGVGAVVGLESRRALFNCWSVYANGRYGVLYGDNVAADDGFFEGETDTFFETIELQVGLEWARCTAGGANLFARVGWEQQMYLVDEMFDLDGRGETGDVSLAGPAFAIGLER